MTKLADYFSSNRITLKAQDFYLSFNFVIFLEISILWPWLFYSRCARSLRPKPFTISVVIAHYKRNSVTLGALRFILYKGQSMIVRFVVQHMDGARIPEPIVVPAVPEKRSILFLHSTLCHYDEPRRRAHLKSPNLRASRSLYFVFYIIYNSLRVRRVAL